MANAGNAGRSSLGEKLIVNRMGFGALWLSGAEFFGEPDETAEARKVLFNCMD